MLVADTRIAVWSQVRLHVASSAVNPSESPVTWRRAVDELQQSDDFRSLIHEAISGSPWDAQFWCAGCCRLPVEDWMNAAAET